MVPAMMLAAPFGGTGAPLRLAALILWCFLALIISIWMRGVDIYSKPVRVDAGPDGVLKLGVPFVLVLVAASVAAHRTTSSTYGPTPLQGLQANDAVRAEAHLLFRQGLMSTLMSDGTRRYFTIEWSDDGIFIRLSLRECIIKDGVLFMTSDSARLPDFAALRQEVVKLPDSSVLFYGGDDVGPIVNAITEKEMIVLARIMSAKGGRLYCFGGG